MPDWIEALAARVARDEPAVLVTVAHASGSVPREAGTTMLVGREDIVGSVGGGHLEFEAIRIARDALGNHANAGTWLVRFPLAARLGQCCGGVATLAFAVIDREASHWIDAAKGDAPMALVSRIGGTPGDGAHLLVTADRASGSLGSAALDAAAIPLARQRIAARKQAAVLLPSPAGDESTLLLNVIVPDSFTVLLFGNGHVGRALVQVLGALSCKVRWVDSRESDFPASAPANVEIVATDAPAAELADAPRGAYVLVMTHSHALDFEIVEAALARDDWRYLGLIGSQSKRNQFAKRLAARGVHADSAARVTCPIGAAPGIAIRSKEPGAIAVAVAAEILALREASEARGVFVPSEAGEGYFMTPRLVLTGITKRYPSVVANDSIDLTVLPGEIHAVLGENGAGKSTLMKIIYGAVKPTAGTIEWEGKKVGIANPARARRLGIGMVFQHFSLFETLTVADNIALALERSQAGPGLPQRITEVSAKYGLPLDPARYIHTMSVGERQRVEIVRCLLQDPRLLIMDEPTSVLTPQAVEKLFETLRRLAAEGCSILYISHKLDEIRALCHKATVLRGGKVTGTCDPRRESSSSLARMMIGGDLPHPQHREAHAGADALVIHDLSLPADDPFGTTLANINLTVRAGEIVGIAGVSGNGQKELMAALSGERLLADANSVILLGTPVGRLDPARRRALGFAFVPEERLGRGAVPEMALKENALLTAHRMGMVKHGFVRAGVVRSYAVETIRAYGVKAGGPDAVARSLSGGNLQKYIVGREIRQQPRMMIAAQPTWGVDVGAAAQIRQALLDLRDSGVGILVVSEELDELFEICDRLAVIAQGRLSDPKPVRDTNAEEIGLLMSGSFIAAGTQSTRAFSPAGMIAHD